jgi:hypothetical protein
VLTPYDEFPVHQYAYPFSQIPASDFNWDDGYYFGVYNADAGIFLYTGMRITPNADMIGCYAGVTVRGRQTTVRASRIWRPDFRTEVGPLRFEFVEPFREIRLLLDRNDSPFAFDLRWLGLAPAHEEAHHLARHRGRVTTDQTRYTQGGTAEGWIEIGGERHEVRAHEWYADRDHSWGLYEPRGPLSDPREWLPPREDSGPKRMFRFWLPFQARDLSGFYHFHEDEHGRQGELNDPFGTPFEGAIDAGFDGERLALVRGRHSLRFRPGSRVLEGGTVQLEDEHGREWRQELEVTAPAWVTFPIGYYQGNWRDGGNIHTYHGQSPYVEWDELDFTTQPTDHTDYAGRKYRGILGAEYAVRVRTEGPDGIAANGLGHLEFFIHRRYRGYSFEQ